MEQNLSQVFGTIAKFVQTKGTKGKEYAGVIKNCIATYCELFDTGGIQSSAEGTNIILELQASVCGDILILYRRNDNPANAGVNVTDLIQADAELGLHKDVAVKVLRQKYKSLMALPELLIWGLSLFCVFPYLWHNFNSFSELFTANVTFKEISDSLLAIFTMLAMVFRNTIGFLLLKPLVIFVTWVARLFRKPPNKRE